MENLEIKQIKNALVFCNSLENENRENFKYLLGFLTGFSSIYDKEKSQLPYHINLIDELHADENAHSRIFAKLLRYEVNNKYLFLENFLNDVCKFNLRVEKPNVEKVDSCGRIDIPIFDKSYAVIIENKVTNKATDQNTKEGGQLARYIETIQNQGRKSEEIFVIYTPKYSRDPSDDCWINKSGYSYKDEFKSRFCSLSYRDDIYPWLKNDILPKIAEGNIYLRSATEQYIDHLEGMFSLRSENKKMNMELQNFIKKELGLQDDKPEEAKEILSEKEIELNNALNQIQLLKNKYQKQIVVHQFERWEKSLQTDFPALVIVGDKFTRNENIINLGVKFSFENKNFVAIIECNNYVNQNVYFGIGRHFVSETKHEIPNELQSILNDNELVKPVDFWYGWKYTSFRDAYSELKVFIDKYILKITQV